VCVCVVACSKADEERENEREKEKGRNRRGTETNGMERDGEMKEKKKEERERERTRNADRKACKLGRSSEGSRNGPIRDRMRVRCSCQRYRARRWTVVPKSGRAAHTHTCTYGGGGEGRFTRTPALPLSIRSQPCDPLPPSSRSPPWDQFQECGFAVSTPDT